MPYTKIINTQILFFCPLLYLQENRVEMREKRKKRWWNLSFIFLVTYKKWSKRKKERKKEIGILFGENFYLTNNSSSVDIIQ